jgi:hypothetical protein
MADTIEVSTIDEAKQIAGERTGPCLVLSRETLDQIEAAEAAGGFEGGMSGASGQGGFSAPGSGGSDSSSASDPVPAQLLQMDGAVPVGAFFEGIGEKILEIRDVWDAIAATPWVYHPRTQARTRPVFWVPRARTREF